MLTALLCSDGSIHARTALAEGLQVIQAADRIVLAMAVAPVDAPDAFGTGVGRAPGTLPEAAGRGHDRAVVEARAQLAADAAALGLSGAELTVVLGSPGPAICALAQSLPASVIVLSARGRSGLRRAVLGSVSDHVIRHAPCPVAVVGPAEHPAEHPADRGAAHQDG